MQEKGNELCINKWMQEKVSELEINGCKRKDVSYK